MNADWVSSAADATALWLMMAWQLPIEVRVVSAWLQGAPMVSHLQDVHASGPSNEVAQIYQL